MKLIKTRKTGSYHFVGFVRVSSFAAVEHSDNKRTEEEEISVDLVEGKRTVSVVVDVVALHQEKKKKGLARDEREGERTVSISTSKEDRTSTTDGGCSTTQPLSSWRSTSPC